MKRQAANAHAGDQDLRRADAIDEITDRSLGESGHDAEHRDRETELDEADAEPVLQQRKQQRQDKHVKVADPMRSAHQQASLYSRRIPRLRRGCAKSSVAIP